MTQRRLIAYILATSLGILALFQVVLALGAPLGAFAWGGSGGTAVLPDRLRAASGAAAVVLLLFAAAVLGRAGVFAAPRFERTFRIATWVLAVQLILNTVGNLASPSFPERVVMTPLSALMAVLAVLLARK